MPEPSSNKKSERYVYKAGSAGRRPPANLGQTGTAKPPKQEQNALPEPPQAPNKPVSSAPAKPSAKASRFRVNLFAHNKKNTIIIAAIICVLVVALAAVTLVAAFSGGDEGTVSLPVIPADQMQTESGYDQQANSLPVSQFGNTILAETEDAGADYVKETLFLGDSNTARMLSYRDITNVTLENSIGVVGMGIQSVTNLACAKFEGKSSMVTMPQAVKIMQPRRIVITFGTNNAGGMGEESFIKAYKNALDAIHTAYPYSDIIIGAVPPIARVHANDSLSMSSIDKFNIALANLAEQEGYKFLNWSEALKDPGSGFCREGFILSSDGIHISRDGMQAMFQYMRTHSYISEDTRPKPLASIPRREGTLPSVVSKDPIAAPATSKSGTATTTTATTTPSSAPVGNVNVVFSAGEGGSIHINGGAVSSTTVQAPPGGSCPTATAVANEGYQFSYWACSMGQVDPGNPTLGGFVVPGNAQPGTTISITAVFVRIEVPAPVTSAPAPPPSSTPTPVSHPEEPPAETATPEATHENPTASTVVE